MGLRSPPARPFTAALLPRTVFSSVCSVLKYLRKGLDSNAMPVATLVGREGARVLSAAMMPLFPTAREVFLPVPVSGRCTPSEGSVGPGSISSSTSASSTGSADATALAASAPARGVSAHVRHICL
eukprot:6434711-Amphidinium_carterae.1